jgi:hypothetical protein
VIYLVEVTHTNGPNNGGPWSNPALYRQEAETAKEAAESALPFLSRVTSIDVYELGKAYHFEPGVRARTDNVNTKEITE